MTPMLKNSMSNEEIIKLEENIPLGRIARIEEINRAIIFFVLPKLHIYMELV